MLDAYIIEEIKRQEEERRRKEEAGRPRLHIESDDQPRPTERQPDDETPGEAGAIRVEILLRTR